MRWKNRLGWFSGVKLLFIAHALCLRAWRCIFFYDRVTYSIGSSAGQVCYLVFSVALNDPLVHILLILSIGCEWWFVPSLIMRNLFYKFIVIYLWGSTANILLSFLFIYSGDNTDSCLNLICSRTTKLVMATDVATEDSVLF